MRDTSQSEPGRVRLKGRLLCSSAEEAGIVATHLPEHIRLTRAEPGCLSFEAVRSDDPLIWHVEECFRDKAAFEFHRERTRASAWGTATAAIRREFDISGLD